MTNEAIQSKEYAEARNNILSHLPADLILARYAQAAGDEIRSGKLASKESSAALAANVLWSNCSNRGHLCGGIIGNRRVW